MNAGCPGLYLARLLNVQATGLGFRVLGLGWGFLFLNLFIFWVGVGLILGYG